MLLATRLSSSRQPTLSAFAASLLSAALRSIQPQRIHRLHVFLLACGSLRAAGCHAFCTNTRYPATQGKRLYLTNSQKAKNHASPCVVPLHSGLLWKDENTKALHFTPHIASPRSSYLTAFRSSTLAPLAGRLASLRSFLSPAGLAVRTITLRSTASVQPFSSRLFFLRGLAIAPFQITFSLVQYFTHDFLGIK